MELTMEVLENLMKLNKRNKKSSKYLNLWFLGMSLISLHLIQADIFLIATLHTQTTLGKLLNIDTNDN